MFQKKTCQAFGHLAVWLRASNRNARRAPRLREGNSNYCPLSAFSVGAFLKLVTPVEMIQQAVAIPVAQAKASSAGESSVEPACTSNAAS